MEANATKDQAKPHPIRDDYTSRPGALIWSFRKSRDRWKAKYQRLKAASKADKVKIADLTKSRQQWRLKAEQAGSELAALRARVAGGGKSGR